MSFWDSCSGTVACVFLLYMQVELGKGWEVRWGGGVWLLTSKLWNFDFSRHAARDCHIVPHLTCRLPAHCTMQS